MMRAMVVTWLALVEVLILLWGSWSSSCSAFVMIPAQSRNSPPSRTLSLISERQAHVPLPPPIRAAMQVEAAKRTTESVHDPANRSNGSNIGLSTKPRGPAVSITTPLSRVMATVALTATLWWMVPATDVSQLFGTMSFDPSTSSSTTTTITVFPQVAMAKEMASGSGSRVNKDPESLLRYGLPINNKEVRKLQVTIEDIKYDIGSKRKSAALDGVKKAKNILAGKDADKIKAACRESALCADYMSAMVRDALEPLSIALKDSTESFQGSEQEREALDRAYKYQKAAVDTVGLIEEQMVPAGYRTTVPPEYSDLPQLHGRATVQMVVEKANKGATFDVSGTTFDRADMTLVIDGYAAPVTSGNFIDLVLKGFYNGMPIQRSDGFVVQTGDPVGEAEGYVGKGSASVGNGKHGERLIPLEIFVKGDPAPLYETTIEDEGRGGQATVLPFNAYGAMGWAREEYDPNSGSSQFFWLLFESDLTPAGKNVLDGRYPCFGYVVQGADFLSAMEEGDVIVSAKVVKGQGNLKLPAGAS